uniref:Cytochrome P450 734A1 n=1 Tax=Anthurium amnicola TaxID=1678845 RepID=A0A1D1ZGW4_9ARAE
MASECEGAATAAAVPYTLLGLLLQGDRSTAAAASDGACAVSGLGGFGFVRAYVERATNAVLWAGLVAVTALLLRRLGRLARLWAEGSRIPGPPCTSFCGHSKLIPVGANLTGYLPKLHEKYGPIVRLWLGPTQLLVSVTDLALIKEVLTKAEDKLPLTGSAFRLAFGNSSLFAPSFDKVQRKRESLENHLNSKLHGRSSAISLKVVNHVLERVDSITASGLVDCREMSQHMAFYVIGATLFGDSFLAWSNAAIYEEILMMIAKDASFWASYNVPPIWKRGFLKYRQLCSRLKCLTRDILQQCGKKYKLLEQIDQSSTSRRTRDEAVEDSSFIIDDILAEGMLLEEIDEYLISKDEPCGNIMGMMFHGCLTTSGLINSILTSLAMNPEIQDKIFSEIVEVNKRDSEPHLFDIQKMRFLLATVYESARLLSAGSLLQRCSLKHDLKLRTSITIPAGAILVVPVQLVQMDVSIWGKDACQFNPLRFLSKSIEHESTASGWEDDSVPKTALSGASQHDSEESCISPCLPRAISGFLPFGAGQRACVGQKFALLGISTLLASLLQVYEIRLHTVQENDVVPMRNEVVYQRFPSQKIQFVKRS